MNSMDIFLIGLAWIMTAAVIFGIVCAFLLATWMQVNDRRDEDHGTCATENRVTPAVHKRRRAAC